MYLVASASIIITMSLALIRAMLGPTVFDRVLAINMFGTKTVLLICVICVLKHPVRHDFLDLALLYSLMNFIGMVALLKFSEFGTFGDADKANQIHQSRQQKQHARVEGKATS